MGAIKAEGIKNQLGRPTLDRYVLLVREAAQNSWDAADPAYEGPVRFSLALCSLEEDAAREWRRVLSEKAPSPGELPLLDELDKPLSILYVSDRGTRGLGGPTRADATTEEEAHDYVSFLLNVGDPRDSPLGGGTYGFGKAVFFLASTAGTVLIHTRCRDEFGNPESRLIGSALGPGFEADGRAFTGRHWFGLPEGSSEIVEPVRGEDADRIARALGFPPFQGDELGTTVAVVAPNLDGQSPEAVAERMAQAILWHLWPKMVDRGTGPAMLFAVSNDGASIPITDPDDHPALREYAGVLRELDELGETIGYGPGAVPVGKIRVRTTYAPPPIIDEVGQEAGFAAGVHHCCLLRGPELVVDYRPGPPLPDDLLWYAAVFRVLPEHDPTFARSEPPTHDAWSPENLDDRDRSLVRTTLRKIDQALSAHAAPRPAENAGGNADGLAAMSRILGGLLAPAPGEAAGPPTTPASGGTRSRTVKMVGLPEWTQLDGRDVVAQTFEVDGRRGITVDADTTVRVWGGGGREGQPPSGAAVPRLVGWRDPQGVFHPAGRLAIGAGEGGLWHALVASPPDTVTRIRVREATGELDG
jgi:hypothetical protein